MAFSVVEKDMEHGDARMVLRCRECDEMVVVWGTFDEESVDAHECARTCISCLEPITEAGDLGNLIHLTCHADMDDEEALQTIKAHYRRMTPEAITAENRAIALERISPAKRQWLCEHQMPALGVQS